MNPARHCFVLNLDAESELEDPSAQTSPVAVRERIRALEPKLAALIAGGVVVDGVHGTRGASGLRGLAWCPTPSALDRLRAAGAVPAPAPSLAILQRVNHRRFSFDLGPTLPGERWATRIGDVVDALGDGRDWVLKAGHGFAGRGRLRLRAPLSHADEPRIAKMIETEGAQLEPLVKRVADWAIHGHLSIAGTLTAGALTTQVCDERGAWVSSARVADGEGPSDALRAELARVGRALHEAGYFGPFGIDAFTWTDGASTALRTRCEINARYSMGWATGMGAARPDLIAPEGG